MLSSLQNLKVSCLWDTTKTILNSIVYRTKNDHCVLLSLLTQWSLQLYCPSLQNSHSEYIVHHFWWYNGDVYAQCIWNYCDKGIDGHTLVFKKINDCLICTSQSQPSDFCNQDNKGIVAAIQCTLVWPSFLTIILWWIHGQVANKSQLV